MTKMIDTLGQYPQYLGPLLVNGKHYGFVFQGKTENVLVTWSKPGVSDTFALGNSATLLNPITGATSTGSSLAVSNTPMMVIGISDSLVAQAKANRNAPLPWNGDFSKAKTASVRFGTVNQERGIHQNYPDSSSTAVTAYGENVRYAGVQGGQAFYVDPNFLSYDHGPITVSVVVRRNEANTNAGFNFKYESSVQSYYKGWSNGWYTIPGNTQWYTKTFTIPDPEFNGMWGYNFSLDSDSTTYSQYYLKSLTITRGDRTIGFDTP